MAETRARVTQSLPPAETGGAVDLRPDGALAPRERAATVWVSRLTGLVGAVALVVALVVWFARYGHYRFVLALFTVAMFCAIVHTYVMDEPQVNGEGHE